MLQKAKKPLIVIFITALIWIYSDFSLEEDLTDQSITIVARTSDPQLWVSFNNESFVTVKADLRGPGSEIRRLKRDPNELQVVFDAETERFEAPGGRLVVLRFLQERPEIKKLNLKVKDCRTYELDVQVVELVQKTLEIQCYDENGTVIPKAEIAPDTIKMSAPADRQIARVRLNAIERKQAREDQIEKYPYILMPDGSEAAYDKPVKIKLPATSENFKQSTIAGNLGYVYSGNIAGKYQVVLENEADIVRVQISATPKAKAAYEAQSFQVLLEIDDKDASADEVVPRKVIYNFPQDFIRTGDIQLSQDVKTARFKLVPVGPAVE